MHGDLLDSCMVDSSCSDSTAGHMEIRHVGHCFAPAAAVADGACESLGSADLDPVGKGLGWSYRWFVHQLGRIGQLAVAGVDLSHAEDSGPQWTSQRH